MRIPWKVLVVALVVGVAYAIVGQSSFHDNADLAEHPDNERGGHNENAAAHSFASGNDGLAAMATAGSAGNSSPTPQGAPQSRLPTSKDLFAALLSGTAEADEKPSVVQMMHRRFEAERVDPSWSANVEVEAKGFFDGQPSAKNIEIVTMECHTSICEVLSAGTSADTSGQVAEQWQDTVYTSPRQSWWGGNGLKDITMAMTTSEDGRMLFATYLTTSALKSNGTGP